MPARRITWLDVFTDRPLTGNGLAVVHDADGLDGEVMLGFARETRLSETTFVQSPEVEGADYRNRIFTARGEVPFAGHPSLGTAVALAAAQGRDRVTYRQQTRAGVQPVDVERDGRRARASMLQEPPVLGEELDGADALRRLGLDARELDGRLGAQIVSTGVPQVLVCVNDPSALDRCRPDHGALGELIDAHGALVVYLASVSGERAVARAFTGPDDVGEDPATGSAAGPLLALAHARAGTERLTVTQGVAMGRPSRLRCSLEGDTVRVAGDVVVLFEGELRLDA